jgi:hypothetical protein
MEVNFDNLRKKIIANYNSLVTKLNSNKTVSGYIMLDPDYIRRDLDNLRSDLITLACIYQEGEDGFKQLDENIHFEEFDDD